MRLSTGVKETPLLRVDAYDPVEDMLRDSVGDQLPAFAEVLGLIEVRCGVVVLVPRGGYVGCSGIVRRKLDDADQGPLGQIGWSDFRPCCSAVARELDEAVVGARPKEAFLVG